MSRRFNYNTFFWTALLLAALVLAAAGCGRRAPDQPRPGQYPLSGKSYVINGKRYHLLASSAGFREEGEASWYGKKFHGRKTANGETYDMHQLTAAHKTLPFHTWVKVVNLDNRREVKVRINDRGPFHAGRVIDLSHAGARALGMVESGTARVTVEALGAAEIREINGRPEPVLVKPKSYSHGQFVVQVGSFKVKSNAVRLSKMMKKRHGRARVTVYDRGDAVFYRVHVGDEKTIGDAMDLRAELERQGYRDSFVVAY